MMRRGKNKYFLYPLIIPLLILIIYLTGFRFYIVLTDSMHPSIPRYSLVITRPAYLGSPVPGDIIVYRIRISREYLVIHRVIGIEGNRYITKGDNRPYRDPWTPGYEDIEGVSILAIPYLGAILLIMRPVLVFTAVSMTMYPLTKHVLTKIFIGDGEGKWIKR